MAVVLVIGPIFEADLLPQQYGFRPGVDAKMAVRRVFWHVTQQRRQEVVDADLRDYFTSIPHAPLMRSLERRIADSRVLKTIKRWLVAPVVETISGRSIQTAEARRRKRGTPQGGVISPLTQKVISSSNGQLRDGEQGTLYLIYVLRSNTVMAFGAVDQSGEGSAAERRSWPTPASCCTSRSSAAIVTRVRFVRASSIPLFRGGLPARSTSRSYRGHGADHVEASAAHGGTAAEVREKQWHDYWSDRDRRVERVSRRSEETWLSRAPRAAHFKSVLTMSLIDSTIQNSLRPTVFWCRFGSAPSAAV
jgi:Reverse transcriptase (RNA-dependent DNA polymerase)